MRWILSFYFTVENNTLSSTFIRCPSSPPGTRWDPSRDVIWLNKTTDKEAEDLQSGVNTSLKEWKHMYCLPKYCAVKLCAPRERLTIFRKRPVETFGNMPKYSHNWARDTGNANFGRGIFWKSGSDPVIPPFKTFQHWQKLNYQQGETPPVAHRCLLKATRALPHGEGAPPGGLHSLSSLCATPSFGLIEPPAVFWMVPALSYFRIFSSSGTHLHIFQNRVLTYPPVWNCLCCPR